MAVSIDWPTGLIMVPRADMPIIQASPEIRSFDLAQFRLDLKALEETPEGMVWTDTHAHNTEYTISGFTYVRAYAILAPYTVEFEDGQYGVSPFGANANILDVKVANQVSYQSQNSGGLLVTGTSGLTPAESLQLDLILKMFRNRRETDPTTGQHRIFDDDDTTILVEGDIFEDVAGTTPYGPTSQKIDRTDRLT